MQNVASLSWMVPSERFHQETLGQKRTQVVSGEEARPGQATWSCHRYHKGQGSLSYYQRIFDNFLGFQALLFPSLGSFKGSAEHQRSRFQRLLQGRGVKHTTNTKPPQGGNGQQNRSLASPGRRWDVNRSWNERLVEDTRRAVFRLQAQLDKQPSKKGLVKIVALSYHGNDAANKENKVHLYVWRYNGVYDVLGAKGYIPVYSMIRSL